MSAAKLISVHTVHSMEVHQCRFNAQQRPWTSQAAHTSITINQSLLASFFFFFCLVENLYLPRCSWVFVYSFNLKAKLKIRSWMDLWLTLGYWDLVPYHTEMGSPHWASQIWWAMGTISWGIVARNSTVYVQITSSLPVTTMLLMEHIHKILKNI